MGRDKVEYGLLLEDASCHVDLTLPSVSDNCHLWGPLQDPDIGHKYLTEARRIKIGKLVDGYVAKHGKAA